MENVNCPLSENARRSPNQAAVIAKERTWTYREFDWAVDSLCKDLKNEGVQEKHRVAFIAKSHVSTIALFFALFRLKAIACPLSFRIPQEQLPTHFELLKAHHVVDVEKIILSRDSSTPTHPIHLDQLATFLFSSGSSRSPKIACHSFGNHYYNAMGVIDPLQLETSSRWQLSLPLFHVSGIAILFRCFLRGAAVVLTDSECDVTHISLVPTQLYRLQQINPSLKCILLGGAPIPPELLRSSLPIIPTYGMTEMSSIIALGKGNIPLYRKLKIEKDQEIWVGGKTLFKGYWDPDSETVVKADQEGWFPTKDLGRWTEDHQLEVIGRKDRQFISGGENIQPEVIEAALCSLPGIRQATVLPIDDLEFGQRPVAFIDDEEKKYSLETIREKLKSRLPGFMHPVRIFPYPPDSGMKPNLSTLQLQILKLPSKNQE